MAKRPYTKADVEACAALIAAEHGSSVFEAGHEVYEYTDAEQEQYRAEATVILDHLGARLLRKAPPTVTLRRPDDELLEVRIGRRLIAAANHDEHGWSGMDAVERTAVAVARACGAEVQDRG